MSENHSMNKKGLYTAAVIGTGRIGFSLGFDKIREQPASHTFALLANKRIRIIAGCDTNAENLAEWKQYVDKKQGSRGQTPEHGGQTPEHGGQTPEDTEADWGQTSVGNSASQKNAAAASGRPVGVLTFSSVSELFAECHPDIVVIAVNEDSHLQCALDVISYKPKLIILEKPVALNVSEGNQIVEAAEKAKVPVLVNHERRFADDYNFAKKYFSKIGELQTINARLDSGLRVYSREAESTGEYCLLHDGTHLVDIVQFLLENHTAEENVLQDGKITSVYFDPSPEQKGVVRNLSVNFKSEKCPDVNISISGRCRYFGFEIDIIGREGRIRIGNGIHEFYIRQESKLYSGFYSLEKDKHVPKQIVKGKKTGYFSNMVQNCVDFLDDEAPLGSTLKTGINALLILDNLRLQLSNLAQRM